MVIEVSAGQCEHLSDMVLLCSEHSRAPAFSVVLMQVFWGIGHVYRP